MPKLRGEYKGENVPLIYRAGNLIEAQLIVDELQAAGMCSFVTGSYLSGAIGELPPTEIIGVWLKEPIHRDRARAVIDDYEASRRSLDRDWHCDGCGEWLSREFGACWQCGQPYPVNDVN